MDKYLVNIAVPEGLTFKGETRWVHWARVELPEGIRRADAINRAQIIEAAMNAGAPFKVTLTAWSAPRGEDIDLHKDSDLGKYS